jgi:hypothetical protein
LARIDCIKIAIDVQRMISDLIELLTKVETGWFTGNQVAVRRVAQSNIQLRLR